MVIVIMIPKIGLRIYSELSVKLIAKNGTLIIPSFSLERTQEVLYELNNLIEDGQVPKISTYLDSPLAIGITEIYRGAKDYFNKTAKADILGGDDIFSVSRIACN
jgi:metallo-beta-lactamase family protein